MTQKQLKDFYNVSHREFPLTNEVSIINSEGGDCFLYIGKCRYNLKEFYEVHTNDIYDDDELLAMINNAKLIKGVKSMNWPKGYSGCQSYNIGFCYIKDEDGLWNKFARDGSEIDTNVSVEKLFSYLRNNELKIDE